MVFPIFCLWFNEINHLSEASFQHEGAVLNGELDLTKSFSEHFVLMLKLKMRQVPRNTYPVP